MNHFQKIVFRLSRNLRHRSGELSFLFPSFFSTNVRSEFESERGFIQLISMYFFLLLIWVEKRTQFWIFEFESECVFFLFLFSSFLSFLFCHFCFIVSSLRRDLAQSNSIQFGSIRLNPVQFGSIRLNPVQFGSTRMNPMKLGSIRVNERRGYHYCGAESSHDRSQVSRALFNVVSSFFFSSSWKSRVHLNLRKYFHVAGSVLVLVWINSQYW